MLEKSEIFDFSIFRHIHQEYAQFSQSMGLYTQPKRASVPRNTNNTNVQIVKKTLTNPEKYDTILETAEKSTKSNILGFFEQSQGSGGVNMKDNLKIGYSKDNTTIIDIKNIDFTDKKVINGLINDFADKYAYADVEHSLEILPTGIAYTLKGEKAGVNNIILGSDVLKGSMGVHNHPVPRGQIIYDSFSITDLYNAVEYKLGKQYLTSGELKNAFELTENVTENEIYRAWKRAESDMYDEHFKSESEITYKQLETLRHINKYLKGFIFYENF